jgi:hypothetical protein
MDEVIKKLNEHDEKLDKQGKQIDFIAKKVLDHDERFERIEENMATKDDTNKIMTTLDELVGLRKKTEQELTFMGENVKRNTKDIEKIKPLVGLESS